MFRLARHLSIAIAIIGYIYFAFLALRSIVMGGIPFWSDPARDLLAAWQNLSKLTLIGPPSGIPGVFYGPYWIWLLSLPLVFSKDPRFVSFVAAFLPYFIFLPFLLWKFRKTLGLSSAVVVWLLFMLTSGVTYATQLWNPHLAPLLIAVIAYLIADNPLKKPFLFGVVCGLLLNFHMSLGLPIIMAANLIFLVIWGKENRRLKPLVLVGFGFLLIFSPLAIFELRHGGNQTKSFSRAVINSTLYNSAVVGQTGLKRSEIIARFYQIPADILQIDKQVFLKSAIFLALLFSLLVATGKISLSGGQKRLLAFLVISLVLVSVVFISSDKKNPIWEYHYIGVEILILLLISQISGKIKYFAPLLLLWSYILVSQNALKVVGEPKPNFLLLPTLASKTHLVDQIYANDKMEKFSVAAFNPAIYTFDYDYLFRWKGEEAGRTVGQIATADTVYLIIPPVDKPTRDDFINYKTPRDAFATSWEKVMPDKTEVIRRVRKP